ncbi:MAG: aromatic amino acid lyase [Candidatus Pacebacteria bacterium]|nr:aromatic amino acid lyase [Candidatus Paceibacterota bacterium]
MKKITVGGKEKLTIEILVQGVRGLIPAELSEDGKVAMKNSEKVLARLVDERVPIYGLNTQFGDQVKLFDANMHNGDKEYYNSLKERQTNLIKSHNIGLGPDAPEEAVRGALFLRAHCLGQGYSGVRPEVVESLISFFNKKIHPVIKRFGSIGASGDLIPLAAIGSALIGDNQLVNFKGEVVSAKKALKEAGLKPLEVSIRDGLALINGTSFMTSLASLSFYDLNRLFNQMMKALALSLESLLVIDSGFKPLVHELKRHRGEIEVNEFLNSFWKGSSLIRDLNILRNKNLHKSKNKDKFAAADIEHLQDYYSLRSVPQGFGVLRENLEHARAWIEEEMNSVNDNPIIGVNPEEIYHGANFMGYHITSACDILKMDIAQASSWIHSVLAVMVHPRKNLGLPTNLSPKPEILNGFRPIQILAASLAVQNRKLAQAQQAFMIPTEGDNQDVNSLASHAAFDFREAVSHLEELTAILLLAGAQALELRGINKGGIEAKKLHSTIRSVSSFIDSDRMFSDDIAKVIGLLREEKI